MKKSQLLSLTLLAGLTLASCGKLKPLTADNFDVTPTPLEARGGAVPVTIDGRFPAKYMQKKAVVTIIPELRTADGQRFAGQPMSFQGEKVMGNNTTISYKEGGRYRYAFSFPYNEAMRQSDLYITFDARKGSKRVTLPDVKVGYGVVSTAQLFSQTMASDGYCIAPDTFQRVRAEKQEANVMFLINQANLRKSELRNNSVQEFVRLLNKINKEREALNLRNVEVKAYASPEGGFDFNDKLAGKRRDVSRTYVEGTLKQTGNNAFVDAQYTAQDWDGFQKLVQASNIQDKDVILRVLSMYKDPQEREQQIRNMSAGFQELAQTVLPALRRSRLIINYETIGRDDDQIMEQYRTDATKLSVDELLYAATLTDKAEEQEAIYRKTAQYYDKDYRALNNLAVLAARQGDEQTATDYLDKALAVTKDAPEALANKGLIALTQGKIAEAENLLARASNANDIQSAQGILNIAKGNYAQAEQYLEGNKSNSAALAQILNKNYAGAVATLEAVEHPDAMTDYLTAIVKARQGNTATAAEALRKAIAKDPKLADYAAKDLELVKVNR